MTFFKDILNYLWWTPWGLALSCTIVATFSVRTIRAVSMLLILKFLFVKIGIFLLIQILLDHFCFFIPLLAIVLIELKFEVFREADHTLWYKAATTNREHSWHYQNDISLFYYLHHFLETIFFCGILLVWGCCLVYLNQVVKLFVVTLLFTFLGIISCFIIASIR